MAGRALLDILDVKNHPSTVFCVSGYMQWAYDDSMWYLCEREGNHILASQMRMNTTAINGTNETIAGYEGNNSTIMRDIHV